MYDKHLYTDYKNNNLVILMSRTTLGITDDSLEEFNDSKREYEYRLKKSISNSAFLKLISKSFKKNLED